MIFGKYFALIFQLAFQKKFYDIARSRTQFPKSSISPMETNMLIFCLRRANFTRYFHRTRKFSIMFFWNKLPLNAAPFNLIYDNLIESRKSFHALIWYIRGIKFLLWWHFVVSMDFLFRFPKGLVWKMFLWFDKKKTVLSIPAFHFTKERKFLYVKTWVSCLSVKISPQLKP